MENTTKNPNLRQFMTSIIFHRKKLLKLEVSKKNTALMHTLIDQLYTNWLNVHKDANDFQLANFFIQNQTKFQELMPGADSKHYTKFQEGFNTHLSFALNLHTNLPNYSRIKELYKNFQEEIQKAFGEKAAAQVLIHNVPTEYFITNSQLRNHYAHKALDLGNKKELFFLRPKNDNNQNIQWDLSKTA